MPSISIRIKTPLTFVPTQKGLKKPPRGRTACPVGIADDDRKAAAAVDDGGGGRVEGGGEDKGEESAFCPLSASAAVLTLMATLSFAHGDDGAGEAGVSSSLILVVIVVETSGTAASIGFTRCCITGEISPPPLLSALGLASALAVRSAVWTVDDATLADVVGRKETLILNGPPDGSNGRISIPLPVWAAAVAASALESDRCSWMMPGGGEAGGWEGNGPGEDLIELTALEKNAMLSVPALALAVVVVAVAVAPADTERPTTIRSSSSCPAPPLFLGVTAAVRPKEGAMYAPWGTSTLACSLPEGLKKVL
jgi:hypothetical protein